MISYHMSYHIIYQLTSTQLIWYHVTYEIISHHIIYYAMHHTICNVTYVISCHIIIMPYHTYHIQYIIYIVAYTTPITISYIISYIIPCITSYIISHVTYHWFLKEVAIWSTKAVSMCYPHRNWIGVINVLRSRDCCGQHWQNGHYSPNYGYVIWTKRHMRITMVHVCAKFHNIRSISKSVMTV